jgi:RNA polymerase sigma-70 factor (ECF subfamily)
VENESQRSDNDFPSTHWSTVAAAGRSESSPGHAAMERLVDRYRWPLLKHLRWRFQVSGDQAEDWLHSFIEKRVLKKAILSQADQQKGRFRTFLLTALDRFVQDELRFSTRMSRVPEGGLVSMEVVDTEGRIPEAEPKDDPFDHAWAQAVLAEAMERLREFYRAKNRADLWGVFETGFVEPILNETVAPSMEELARRLGYASARQASNGLITAKRMFKQMLGVVIAEYAQGQGAVVEEIRELRERLGTK